MALADEIADDLETFDGVQTVTLSIVLDAGTTTVEVESALRRALVRSDYTLFAGSLDATQDQVVWHLMAANTGGHRPTDGDKITEADGTVWIVTTSHLETLGTRYRVLCTRGRAA